MTGKQRAYLRKLANTIDGKYQIGKEGIESAYYTASINDALEANELIKIHVLENSELDVKTACDLLCKKTGALPIQIIGRKFVIYRMSEKKPKIFLP